MNRTFFHLRETEAPSVLITMDHMNAAKNKKEEVVCI